MVSVTHGFLPSNYIRSGAFSKSNEFLNLILAGSTGTNLAKDS